MEQDLSKVVEEIEEEKARGRVSAVQVFRSMINQPALVSLSSANATDVGSVNSYSSFNVNMPRPILSAATLQLIDAVIPLPTANIPDTACAFWYYRLSAYSGLIPNQDNLFFVRLLPSYYNQEFILNASNYGYNETFTSYSNVATQLALACSNDLALTNQIYLLNNGGAAVATDDYQVKFMPNDISITYNSNINKFQLTGSNVTTPFATDAWASSNTYASNAVVYYNSAFTIPHLAVYQSLQASNSNQNPVANPTWWKQIQSEVVQPWSIDTQYRAGQLVFHNLYSDSNIYRAKYDTHLNGPGASANQPWAALRYYQLNDVVLRTGGSGSWVCIRPNTAIDPTGVAGPGTWLDYAWSSGVTYPINCRVLYNNTSIYQSVIANNIGNTPVSSSKWKLLGSPVVWAAYNQTIHYYYLPT